MAAAQADQERWAIVERWQEYEGETRANLLRVLGIAAFYAIELANYRGLRLGFLQLPAVEGVDTRFHLTVTMLAAAWIASAWAVSASLRRRFFPPALKYLSTGLDIVFLTLILLVADGPRSPLVVAYLLVPSLAALRFSLPLIRFSTAGSIAGYLFLLGNARWLRPATRVPRYHEAIFALALALTGVLLGQLVRRTRRAAANFAARLKAAA